METDIVLTMTEYGGLTHHCDDSGCHVPGFVSTLNRTMTHEELVREVIALRRTQESLLEILAEIQAQIGPVVNSLKDSPILKMMGVK